MAVECFDSEKCSPQFPYTGKAFISPHKNLISQELQDPIFVVGYMHSGTTLMLNILKRHKDIYASYGETKFFDFLPMIRSKYPNLSDDNIFQNYIIYIAESIQYSYRFDSNPTKNLVRTDSVNLEYLKSRVIDNSKGNRDYGAIFRIVFDQLTRIAGKKRWLEKTPTHIYHIDKIIRCIPNAKFVEIVRDPRDILASKKTRKDTVWTTDRYQQSQRRWKQYEKAYDPLWDSLAWKSAIRTANTAKLKHPDSITSVRYEDLVIDPHTWVEKISIFLALDFTSSMLDVSHGIPAEWDKKRTLHPGIVTTSVGRWQKTLPTSDIAVCQILLIQEMKQLSYQSVDIPFNNKLEFPFKLIRSSIEFFNRLYGRWKLGGNIYLINILLNYIKRFNELIHGSD